MFETLLELKREKAATRMVVAFPMALGAQVALACTILLYSIFGAQTIQPPPLFMTSCSFRDSVQVVVPIAQSPGTHRHPPDARPVEGPTAPPAIPDGIPRSPEASPGPPGPPDGDPNGVPGGMPPEPGYTPPAAPVTAPVNTPLPPDRVRVPHLVRKVTPDYPPAAIAMHLTGRVVVQLVVNEEGRVVDALVLSSTNGIFNEAALRAVRQWEFTRPIDAKSQQAVSCYLPVVVVFTLT